MGNVSAPWALRLLKIMETRNKIDLTSGHRHVPDDVRLRIWRAAGRGIVMRGRDLCLRRHRQTAARHARRRRAATIGWRLVTLA